MKTSRLASPANPSGASHLRVLTTAFPAGNPLNRPAESAWRFLAAILGFCAIALASSVFAAESSVRLVWNPNPETDIANYRVNYGTSPGFHPNSVSAGLSTRASVTGLQAGTTYYFVVTAINQVGMESEPSDEVSWRVPVVVPGNRAPVAVADALATAEGTPVAITLAATDPDGDALSYLIVGNPSNGMLSGSAPNLTYTPAAGFNGSDSFKFAANDGNAVSNTAAVSITVTPTGVFIGNHAPVFKSVSIKRAAGQEEKPYQGGSIAGAAVDSDRGDVITFSKVSGPAWLAVSPNGRLSGTPPPGSGGNHRFGVRATDKAGASADCILLIEIAAELPLPWDMKQLGGDRKGRAIQKSGTLALEGSGRLVGSADAGTFIWQALSGDGEIIARVNSLEDAEKATCAGVMIRDSLAPNSKHVFMGVNGDGDFRWVHRSHAGKPAVVKSTGDGSIPKAWLRLVRKGDTLIAYKSANRSDWTRVGAVTANFGTHCYIGLIVSGGKAHRSSATFRNVMVKP